MTEKNAIIRRRIAVVGASGYGKSFFLKNKLLPDFAKKCKNIFIWDKNGEYNPKNDYSLNVNNWKNFERNRNVLIENIVSITNGLILIDEAATVLNNRSPSIDFEEKMIGARHDNVIIVMVYHSLNAIPANLVQYFDQIILFKTHETVNRFKTKFDNLAIFEAFETLQSIDNEQKGVYIVIDI